MSTDEEIASARSAFRDQLVSHGHLLPAGVPGVFGLGGVFEGIVESFGALLTRVVAGQEHAVVRFPPILSRHAYERTGHLEAMPHLLGAVRSFTGNERAHAEVVSELQAGRDWSEHLDATDVVLCPAACYPVYPTLTGTLPAAGRSIDLVGFVFRHEPSEDPARLQSFRQREFVLAGTPEQAVAHRDTWLARAEDIHGSLGLRVERVLASDPFFGRGGRAMKATQKEQDLKFELVTAVSSERPTAITSSNCHLDHFARAFEIRTEDGQYAHTACIGFGLERIAMALLRRHGLDADRWPAEVKGQLNL